LSVRILPLQTRAGVDSLAGLYQDAIRKPILRRFGCRGEV
jgi:hypothetical protein